MRSPIGYAGGKSRLAGRIVSRIPADHECYVEGFAGAAWVLFSKPPSKAEVINDLDGELVTFWRVIQHHLGPFLDCYKYAITSRQMFGWEDLKRPETLTDIQRAVRYYYLQRLAFGGKASGRTFGTSTSSPSKLNLTDIEERLLEVHWRLARVTVEHLDAIRCIEMYDRPSTVFYLDPPYMGTSQSYVHRFGEADFVRLEAALRKVRGRFILSLNDAPAVRELFGRFRIEAVSLTYSQANARSAAGARAKQYKEVLISNL